MRTRKITPVLLIAPTLPCFAKTTRLPINNGWNELVTVYTIIPITARTARPLYGLRYGSSRLTTRWLYTEPYSSSSIQPSVLRRSACCAPKPPPLQPPAPAPPQYAIRSRLLPAKGPLLARLQFVAPARRLP